MTDLDLMLWVVLIVMVMAMERAMVMAMGPLLRSRRRLDAAATPADRPCNQKLQNSAFPNKNPEIFTNPRIARREMNPSGNG